MKTSYTAAVAGLEAALNKALQLDSSTQRKLSTLADHVFLFRCDNPEINLYVIPGEMELRLCAYYEGEIDTQLRGSAAEFFKLISASDPASVLINGKLELQGDSSALINLQNIAKQIDLDWEAPIANLFGDVLGHQIGRGLRHGFHFGRQLFSGLKHQLDDYFIEESNTIPASWQLEKFYNEVDQLSLRTQRLEARLNKFLRKR